ncbi:MAG: hypothetical protein GY913_35960 [Proteobacteria bacterium]|nr:hypothetical protein [Pseudomonadota bacterium]MCP4922327.1 hypothetical protein [Pseudomonadota bacterium]
MLFLLLSCTDSEPAPGTDSVTATELVDVYGTTLGEPVPWVADGDRNWWDEGRLEFSKSAGYEDGLGPTWNATSCADCHGQPVIGGAGPSDRDVWKVFVRDGEDGWLAAGTNGESSMKNLYSRSDGHVPDDVDVEKWVRYNAPALFGIGLLAGVSDETLTALEDPEDSDGDGISGRVNMDDEGIARFGLKAQSSSLAAVVEKSFFNQQGQTSGDRVDTDPAADPEISEGQASQVLAYLEGLAPPAPQEPSDAATAGRNLFDGLGCTGCHLPAIDSEVGPIAAWTDLLLHDMGEDLADRYGPGLAESSEFRTAPLWGVALSGPWLHDGRAETLTEAITAHGGEAAGPSDAFAALGSDDQADVVAFLESLGPEPETPAGLARIWTESEREGRTHNGVSCLSCHVDPTAGGSGDAGTNTILFGDRRDGVFVELERSSVHRGTPTGETPYRLPDEASVLELRQAPTLAGLADIDGISDEAILANADPDDLDEDGISGRTRDLDDGVGRFGWKAEHTDLESAVGTELGRQLGILDDSEVSTLLGELEALEPPVGTGDGTGASVFEEIGCAACHVPELDGVPLYSDLLLHDMGTSQRQSVGDFPGEYRTAPLWGLAASGPFLHDGSAGSGMKAVEQGHGGEASASRAALSELDSAQRTALGSFLSGL